MSDIASFNSAMRKAPERGVRDIIRNKPSKAEAYLMPFFDAAIDEATKSMKGNRKRR